jgi:hypothetical protein
LNALHTPAERSIGGRCASLLEAPRTVQLAETRFTRAISTKDDVVPHV